MEGKVKTHEGIYKGRSTITLSREGSPWQFSFGYTKACLIMGAIDQIKAFKERQDTLKAQAKKDREDTYRRIESDKAPE